MMNTRRKSYRIFLLILCCALLIACGQAPPASNTSLGTKVEPRTAGKRGGSLSYRLSAAPKTFNFVMMSDEPSLMVAMFMLTSRLVEFDHEQKFIPVLPNRGRAPCITYDLTLRDGLSSLTATPDDRRRHFTLEGFMTTDKVASVPRCDAGDTSRSPPKGG